MSNEEDPKKTIVNDNSSEMHSMITDAAKTRDASAIAELLSGLKIGDLSKNSIGTCLKLASSSDNPELLCLFKDQWPDWKNEEDGKTVLHLIADANATECIETLFEDNVVVNVSALDDNGLCPAHLMADKSCSLEGFALILEKMDNVDLVNKINQTCLHLASLANRVENVEILLECGASVEIQDNKGMTPLHCAAIGGCGAIAKVLCKAGASIKSKDSNGATPFVLAICQKSLEVTEELFNHGVGINEPVTSNRDYPLHIATENGNADIVAMMLEKGARTEAKNKKGKTALSKLASNGGSPEVIQTLLKCGADYRALDKTGKSALSCAVENKNYEFIRTIKNHLNDGEFLRASLNSSESTALFTAVEANDAQAIRALVMPESNSRAILAYSSKKHGGRSALSQAMLDFKLVAIVAFVNCGAEQFLLVRDGTGFAPVHYMMLHEEFSHLIKDVPGLDTLDVPHPTLGCTPFLLATLATKNVKSLPDMTNARLINCSAQDFKGYTPLHFACMLGRVDLVKYLLQSGACPNVKNKNGSTPMHSVFSKNNQDLKEYISVFEGTQGLGELGRRLEEMSEAMRRATRKRFFGKTAADEANAKKRLTILKLLMESYGDVMAKDNKQQTLLHLCAFGFDDNDVEAEYIMDQMPDGGKSVMKNAYDWCGYLPLHTAAEGGNIGCTILFLRRGASIKKRTKDEDNQTPLSLACGMGSGGDVARLLLSYGAKPSEVDEDCETVEDLEINGFLDSPLMF